MTKTTIVTSGYSSTVVVDDQDAAVEFYRDVLGCEVRTDVEAWPGARLVEVVPAGTDQVVALLTRDGGLPLGVRWGTADAQAAHRALSDAGTTPHTDVLDLDDNPPLFTFDAPRNTVIVMQEEPARDPIGASTVLAAVPVADATRAREFYERLLGSAPDAEPMPGLVQWDLGSGVAAFGRVVDPDGNALTFVQA